MNRSTSVPSPLSPTLWPPDAFLWWKSLAFAVLLFLATVVPATVLYAFFLSRGVLSANIAAAQTLTVPLLWVQLAGYVIPLILIVTLLPAIGRRRLSDLGWHAPTSRDLLWGLLGAIGMLAAATGVGFLQETLLHVKTQEVQVQWLMHERGAMVYAFAFLAVILAPLFEEWTFRGFVFNAFLRYMPFAVAAVLAGIAFGVIHWQPGNSGAIAPLAAGGMVLCAVYYRTGSLIASMISHGLFNGFTVFAVVVLHQS